MENFYEDLDLNIVNCFEIGTFQSVLSSFHKSQCIEPETKGLRTFKLILLACFRLVILRLSPCEQMRGVRIIDK